MLIYKRFWVIVSEARSTKTEIRRRKHEAFDSSGSKQTAILVNSFLAINFFISDTGYSIAFFCYFRRQ
jgi:hypothetical protein